jgi:ApaG protein
LARVSSPKDIIVELPGLRVTVDKLAYQPHQGVPDRPHCFIYHITIHNDSDVAVTIKARKWVVTADNGEVTAVEGDGVVGQFPELPPGESFTYNSFHLLDSTFAVAKGSYLGVDENGRRVLTRIPPFDLRVPDLG